MRRRWLILLAIIPIIVSTEMMWLTLAPVSSNAESYYGVSNFSVALFSMSYMIMFVVFFLPASIVIDRYGFRASLIVGAIITAVFATLRAIFSEYFIIALITQFCIAAGQPFIINIATKVSTNLFPIQERSTATGILTMAQYLGFIIPMAISPIIVEKSSIHNLFVVFAVVAIVSAVIALLFVKENSVEAEEGIQDGELNPTNVGFSLQGMKCLFRNSAYNKVLIICFVSMGIFNTILTAIEALFSTRGISSAQAGAIGAVFVVAGVIGAVLIPIISEVMNSRIKVILIVLCALIPFYLGLTFINNFVFLCIIAGLCGFSIMGAAPILFQHGSEVAYPIQEGTSLGVILLMGQISGIIITAIFMRMLTSLGSGTIPMLLFVALTALQVPVILSMRESKIYKNE